MLKRNIIIVYVFAVMTGSVSAQVRPGVKVGYNLSGVMAEYREEPGVSNSNGNPDNFRMRQGFQLGVIADCPLNDAFAVQPGLRFSMQGFTDKYRNNYSRIRKFSLFYLQLPVYAQYRLNVAEETDLLFQAGPYIGFGLFGRQSYYSGGKLQTLDEKLEKITFGSEKDIYNAFDYGAGAGIGVEVYRFQLMVNYDYGLNKSTFLKKHGVGTLYNVNMQNHNFSVTLAVIFGRRDPLQNTTDM